MQKEGVSKPCCVCNLHTRVLDDMITFDAVVESSCMHTCKRNKSRPANAAEQDHLPKAEFAINMPRIWIESDG